MTKKKRNHPDVDEVLSRPWCYYCERDFDDLKILINHQKAKHFKCERCGRRLNTAGGLSVHMSQVHKENLSAVDNALPNRAGLDIEIFGMEGIPEDVAQQHTQRVLQNYHQAEAERRAASGNSAAAGGPGGQPKKPKFESPSDLKKRLAEHKAKLVEQQANGGSSGGGTPVSAHASQTQPPMQAPNSMQVTSPQYGQYQPSFNAAPASLPYSQPPQYAQTPNAVHPYQQPQGHPQQSQGYIPQPQGHPQQLQSHPQQPQGYPQQPQSYIPQPSFSPPLYQPQAEYNPNDPFPPGILHNGTPPLFPGMQNGPPRAYGAGSPAQPFQQQFQHTPRNHTPPQHGSFQRSNSGSLPVAPGLPQRPAFGAPPVNAFQFQQMHQGQMPGQGPTVPSAFQQHQPQQNHPPMNGQQQGYAPPPGMPLPQESATASSVDDLISDASKRADTNTPVPATAPVFAKTVASSKPSETEPIKDQPAEDSGTKKDKDKSKATKLVYSDNEISPEEKMAKMARYAYTPDRNGMV